MEESKPKSKLKMTNEKSMFNKPPEPDREEFELNAAKVFNKYELRKRKCAELGAKYISSLNDKTLLENKSPISKELEKDILANLINIGIEINTDESENEGMGSIALITLLLNSLLKQRDKINELSFKLNKLEIEVKSKNEK